jgi:hypothetical protein
MGGGGVNCNSSTTTPVQQHHTAQDPKRRFLVLIRYAPHLDPVETLTLLIAYISQELSLLGQAVWMLKRK